jgi:hypothetical protein
LSAGFAPELTDIRLNRFIFGAGGGNAGALTAGLLALGKTLSTGIMAITGSSPLTTATIRSQ